MWKFVRCLAKKPHGLTRSELTRAYSTGGRLTQTLRELEEAGFVSTHAPFQKKTKDTLYRLSDEYSLFYLKWIEGSKGGSFLKKIGTPAWRAWSGYALESLAHKHVPQIKQALGIGAVEVEACSWVHRPDATWPDGAQVDLLLDRADNAMNLIEIKFAKSEFTITKSYAVELRRKRAVFEGVSGTKKAVFLTFLTTNGVAKNAYSDELLDAEITTDALFAENL